MGFKSEMLEARDEFIALVKDELLGPGSEVSVPDAEHELITTLPEKRYSIGILFPKDNKMKADENDVDRAEQEDNAESEEPTESIASDNSDYVEVKIPENTKDEKSSEDIDDEPEFMAKHTDCQLDAKVDVSEMMGAEIYLYLEYKGNKMTARVAPTSKARNGDTVRVAFDPHKVHLFDIETEQTILN